jgi:AcrR family transcriptional regulator
LLKAIELFSTKGYDATSVREICEAAGITKPTLYHFYGSKEGVYRAIVDGALEDFRRNLMAAIQMGGTPSETLRRIGRTHFANVRRDASLLRFILALVHSPASSAPRTDFPKYYEEIVARIAEVVDDGVRRGDFSPGPIGLRMLAFMGALGEAMCTWLVTGKSELTDELADDLVDVVIAGWRPVVH